MMDMSCAGVEGEVAGEVRAVKKEPQQMKYQAEEKASVCCVCMHTWGRDWHSFTFTVSLFAEECGTLVGTQSRAKLRRRRRWR